MAKKIYLSPSNQTENKYAYGSTNEAIQCRKIADACEVALKRCGFEVKNNKTADMYAKVKESDAWSADLHVPIHTNAYNGKVTGTRIFCWNKTGDGYKASQAIYKVLAPLTPGTSESVSVNADLYEVHYSDAPCVYIEVDFHDVASVAKWIIEHVVDIGEAIAKGICNHFGVKYVEPAKPETYQIVLGEYATIKEADAALGAIYAKLDAAEKAIAEAGKELRKAKIIEQ